MASTISVVRTNALTVVQTFSEGESGNPDITVTGGMNTSSTFTASTTVPVTKHASFDKTMSGGAGTIDLTALPGLTVDETVNFTGLKLQFMRLRNLTTNANIITVSKGASNGYGLNAAGTTWSVVLDPDQMVTFELDDSAPDVAGGSKTIDLAGTGSQVLEVQLVAG